MQGYNCIMVFDKEEEHLLFCKRLWDPYEGKYNLVGGNIGHMLEQARDYGIGEKRK